MQLGEGGGTQVDVCTAAVQGKNVSSYAAATLSGEIVNKAGL
ncbi:hypothetical protein ACFPEN_34965 [Streptomyces ehimensis]|uniref:Uncharacterized protein n=1 Tax=Streptomyces ehimensis TaxID=68195 RepID=A0ABV9BVK8_9ACTN